MPLTNGSKPDGSPPNGSPLRASGVHRTFLLAVLILTAIPAWQLFATLPHQTVVMDQLIPAEARAGATVTITGFALDPAHIEELYLIDEKDVVYSALILSETGTSLRFRVPAKIPPGIARFAVKAPGRGELIDPMLYLRILDPVG